MSQPLLHNALKPLFKTWFQVVGPEVAATTRVSVVGGLYIQARDIRFTTDIDVIVKSAPLIDRFKIRDQIAASDRRFTVKICGLTFREKAEDPVTPIDIIDDKVTLYMPEGMTLLDVINEDMVPLPTDSETIVMKMIAAADRLKSRTPKALQDLDDAMKIFGKLYHEEGYISYKNEDEKTTVKMAFNNFWPRYKEAKEEAGEKGMGFGLRSSGRLSSRSTRSEAVESSISASNSWICGFGSS